MAKSTDKKTEKFHTLQSRNLLNEMLDQRQESAAGEVGQLKSEKVDAEELAEELGQSLATNATQVTTLGIAKHSWPMRRSS